MVYERICGRFNLLGIFPPFKVHICLWGSYLTRQSFHPVWAADLLVLIGDGYPGREGGGASTISYRGGSASRSKPCINKMNQTAVTEPL